MRVRELGCHKHCYNSRVCVKNSDQIGSHTVTGYYAVTGNYTVVDYYTVPGYYTVAGYYAVLVDYTAVGLHSSG